MIKTIIFDYMGVFVPDSIIGKYIKTKFKNPEQKLDALKKLTPKWDLGEMDYDQFNQTLSKYSEIPENQIWEFFFKKVITDKELVDFVKILKKKYKIVLLSNGPLKNGRLMLKNQNIENLFDEIIFSAEHNLMKPDPKIYKLALSLSNTLPSEAIFIDDRLENVEGGQKAGIKSFLFTGTKKLKEDLNFLIEE